MGELSWITGHRVELPEMLDGREHRAALQQELRSGHPGCTLISFTMNIAGPVKVFPLGKLAFEAGFRAIGEAAAEFPQEYVRTEWYSYGREAFWVLDAVPEAVKRAMVRIEETHGLGRLFDIDVIRPDGSKVSREEVGYPGRRCLLCGRPAVECGSRRLHTVPQLQRCTAAMILRWAKQAAAEEPDPTEIAPSNGDGVPAAEDDRPAAGGPAQVRDRFADPASMLAGYTAETAMLQEVYTTPKPGLVDRNNTGAHADMDVPMFEASAAALSAYFADCFRIGRAHRPKASDTLLQVLRPLGVEAEQRMYAVTGGINTHKGMIFSLGILCGAWGYLGMETEAEQLLDLGGKIAAPALNDFAADGKMSAAAGGGSGIGESDDGTDTAGMRQYRAYGLTGIRGEAAAGFPSVRKGLEFSRRLRRDAPACRQQDGADGPENGFGTRNGLTEEQEGTLVLLHLIGEVEDSNMIRRVGRERSEQLRLQAAELLDRILAGTEEPAAIEDLDRMFTAEHASPGGCADMLALIRFLELTEDLREKDD